MEIPSDSRAVVLHDTITGHQCVFAESWTGVHSNMIVDDCRLFKNGVEDALFGVKRCVGGVLVALP